MNVFSELKATVVIVCFANKIQIQIYVANAMTLFFPVNVFICLSREKCAVLEPPGQKWWNQAAIPDFDAESKLS